MRIATLTSLLRSQNSVVNLQDRLSLAQEQVSTGKISSVYSGLIGDSARISVQLREEVSTKEAYLKSIDQVQTRMTIMESALVAMQDLAEEMRSELIKQVEGLYGNSAPVLKEYADSVIDQFASLLNTQADGRYIFNGTDVGTAPIINSNTIKTNAFAAITPLAVGNAATLQNDSTTFFGTDANWNAVAGAVPGQNKPFQIAAADGVRLEFGELANDNSTFEEIFEVLAVFADVDYAAGLDDDYGQLVSWGLNKIEAAADAIGVMISSLGTTAARMQQLEDQHREDITVLSKQLDTIENVDPFEAVANFQLIQGQLQAAYQTTASLRRFSLAQYL